MKPEDQAWSELRMHASAQLRGDFVDGVLRAARGPRAEVWQQLRAVAASRLRPGFAGRVIQAARSAAEVPSVASQFALSAATAAVCLGAVLFLHNHYLEQSDARNLAEWQRIVAAAQEIDTSRP